MQVHQLAGDSADKGFAPAVLERIYGLLDTSRPCDPEDDWLGWDAWVVPGRDG